MFLQSSTQTKCVFFLSKLIIGFIFSAIFSMKCNNVINLPINLYTPRWASNVLTEA